MLYIVGITTKKVESGHKDISIFKNMEEVENLVPDKSIISIDWIKSVDVDGNVSKHKLKLNAKNKIVFE